MMQSARVVVQPLRFFQATVCFPRRHLHLQYQMASLPGESKSHFCQRMQKQVFEEISKHPNYLLFMTSGTRIAQPKETLANAAKHHGVNTLLKIGLGYAEHKIFTGHCAVAYINEKGEVPQEETFSLQPDTRFSPLYKALTAPDPRLPDFLTSEPTFVRRAIHTSIKQEISLWASNAFYAHYVHSERTGYPLHCFLKPLSSFEREGYFKAVKALKASCKQYSLLDHFREDQLMGSENCTLVFRLLEWMVPMPIDLKKLLGDNPTPQLVGEVLCQQLLKYEAPDNKKGGELVRQSEDVLSKPFTR